MAGIVGAVGSQHENWVEKALAKIAHRGGAGQCVRSVGNATVGQVWPAAQETFASGVDRLAVVLDGEIHNWTQISVGATCALEALQEAYQDRGAEFVQDLDGPFALAIASAEGVFLARDRVGKSPLYYEESGGRLCFASEMKALLEWETDISEFPPGHYYRPGIGLVRYAEIEEQPTVKEGEEEVAEELRGRLVSAVNKRVSEGEVGAWLSGGIDSATMTALACRQLPRFATFAAGVEGATDLEYARVAADFLGTDHHERRCTLEEMLEVLPEVIYHLESFDALLVRSSVTNFLVGRLASEHVGAVLSGEGGDELFGGYSYLKKMELEQLPEELVDITQRLHNTALQRVDRCSASHGLVARTGFLDGEVLDYALRIPPEMKLHGDGTVTEKWILRRAMDGLLPEEVLQRTKAKFWEGAGVGELLAAHAEEVISDAEFAAGRRAAEGVELNTKEEMLYYRVFREVFGAEVDPMLVGRTKGAPVAK
jgi:asparagine synthase (glutamine-hydrolysing)